MTRTGRYLLAAVGIIVNTAFSIALLSGGASALGWIPLQVGLGAAVVCAIWWAVLA